MWRITGLDVDLGHGNPGGADLFDSGAFILFVRAVLLELEFCLHFFVVISLLLVFYHV